ncbi:MAG: hypothetical protein E7513_06460 [Ruminococcaceae bacterium]|nr:hypothetical protein [Oscillospiraceae bacterium]
MADTENNVATIFSGLISSGRVPHAVLIEGDEGAQRDEAVKYLSRYAVCSGENRPCGTCKNCIKAFIGGHPDIYTPKLSGKTNIISVDAVRELIKDASIIPNEANTKVFILNDIDKCMSDISQNAFLKILEEPPQSTLFILTAQKSKRLLSTILSRVQVFSLNSKSETNEETDSLAKDIITGILSPSEIKLLYATAKINSRDVFKSVLPVVSEYLRLGLNKSVGSDTDNDIANAIAKKLTKSKIMALIELSSKAIIKADRNVNMNLLCTWLCGEYRRISWLR